MTNGPEDHKRILYGRRRGHKLRPGQQELVNNLLPHLLVSLPDEGRIDPADQFENPPNTTNDSGQPGNAFWLEVGFGGGEHLAAQAEANPNVSIFGCEPFENGVASLLAHIENKGLRNVRIHNDDARDLIAALPEASIDRAFLLFPDPWPKSRHAKRRFVSPENLTSLARVLTDDAEFRVATDHVSYCRWALSQLLKHPDFSWQAECASDWRVRSADWPPTRYEQKALDQGRKPVYFKFRRKMRESN